MTSDELLDVERRDALEAPIVFFDEYDFDREVFDGCVCVFGVFDGFHRGHQYIVGSALSLAHREGQRCVILTFDRDPDELFRPQELRKLMSNERRLSLLAHSGADLVVALPFTKEFAAIDPDAFLYRTFGYFAPASLHVGTDFRFGYRAAGTVDTLQLWSEKSGTEIMSYSLMEYEDEPVTATRIRNVLAESDVQKAEQLLGRKFSIKAPVEPGRQQGREMGFATANLAIPTSMQVLGAGVYGAYAMVGDKRYKAAVSMGVSPTFSDATAVCEVHLLDYSGDLYGFDLEVEFAAYLRPMVKFESVDELIATVTANIDWCRANL